MSRPTVKVIFKETGAIYLVNTDHYKKYSHQYDLVEEDKESSSKITDEDIMKAIEIEDKKELRDFLREKGITFSGNKSRANMIKLLDSERE